MNFNGGGDYGVLYAANNDTVNINGQNSLFVVAENTAGFTSTGTGGNVVNVSGNSTVLFQTGFNTISGANGAVFYVLNNNNILTGSGLSANIQGHANTVNVTGSDTVNSASPFSYQTTFEPGLTTQNFFTVQGGQVQLGGQDVLVQTQGSAEIGLFGGNAVTLNGSNDTINARSEVYGGNTIVNNGTNNTISLQDVANSADTIIANASTYVNIQDIAANGFGITGNSNEKLDFIGGASGSNTILGSASNAAVTFVGGAGSANVVYGGSGGNNSLNGGSGGYDLLKGGGTNDVLIAGTAGANTLVSAAGNETFVGSSVGNDLFSITGGGGTDLVQNFKGNLELSNGLFVASQSTASGSLSVLLNDGTQVIFSGLTSVTQNGNIFSH